MSYSYAVFNSQYLDSLCTSHTDEYTYMFPKKIYLFPL